MVYSYANLQARMEILHASMTMEIRHQMSELRDTLRQELVGRVVVMQARFQALCDSQDALADRVERLLLALEPLVTAVDYSSDTSSDSSYESSS